MGSARAFEHRFAAAIADGGVVNVGRTWFGHIPPQLLDLYRSGDKATFDQYMRQAMAAPEAKAARETWAFRARPYGVEGYSVVLEEVTRYDVTDVAGQVTTPLYITDPDGEQFFCGQSAELAALVLGSTLSRFTQEEGESYHCQPMARELTEQRMFDWLDEHIARYCRITLSLDRFGRRARVGSGVWSTMTRAASCAGAGYAPAALPARRAISVSAPAR